MRKRDELTNKSSCMNKAREDEMTFVLLGRDVAAPATIRFWINERLRLGKNHSDSCQITEAEECARIMEQERGIDPSPTTLINAAPELFQLVKDLSDYADRPKILIQSAAVFYEILQKARDLVRNIEST
jgi:hypothetical protein